jgi:2-keto-4-pentenoate hydratase/2-oxohepta-3-ene-1,7-dioic acid hydratase in catechol pathway
MKLVAFEPDEGDTRTGAFSKSEGIIYDLQETPLVSGERTPLANAIERVCTDSKALFDDIDAPTHDADSVSLSAPVPADGRVICLGGMYTQHTRERNDQLSRVPSQWLAPDCAVIGPDEPVVLPERVSEHVVPAAELGVVIGQECRYLNEEAVSDYIAGYTVCNDITARTDWPGPMAYKLMEGFWPTGPSITPAYDVTNPTALDMTIDVGEERICEGSTTSMRFSLPFAVSYLSQILKLRPGDVISTGDPGRVNGRLQPGADVTVSIESVGTLTNPVTEG